jgi:hypothetical protein
LVEATQVYMWRTAGNGRLSTLNVTFGYSTAGNLEV